jgi:hypothetical protein
METPPRSVATGAGEDDLRGGSGIIPALDVDSKNLTDCLACRVESVASIVQLCEPEDSIEKALAMVGICRSSISRHQFKIDQFKPPPTPCLFLTSIILDRSSSSPMCCCEDRAGFRQC